LKLLKSIEPRITIMTIAGLRKYLIDHDEKSMGDIIGSFTLS
jgi:hypothetical protein